MNLPKIVFSPMSLEENIEAIKWSFYEDLSLRNYTIQYFPELAIINSNTSETEVNRLIETIVTKEYIKCEKKIVDETKRYNNIWGNINDKYFEILTDFLGESFPENVKQINASVGLIPICPRDLDSFSFLIQTDMEDSTLIKTAAHEVLHFLWFLKWKSMYPKTPRSYFDSPYIEWKYSEMVTDPILNNKPFSDLFEFNEKGYDTFYELYDGSELVMDKLKNIYASNCSIEEKIRKGFTYITNYFNKSKGRN